MRRSLGSGWGIATAVRKRAAATNRNPPKPLLHLPELASESADSFVTWYSDVYYEGKLRQQYDSGDHAHLNGAGTDVIVARAVPDVERLLMRLGSRPTR
jgi:hypothetical protein